MTPKQYKFCEAFIEIGSAHGAAIEAGYTKQYARSNSNKLLQNPEIVAHIKLLRERANQRAEKTATDVVNEYAKIAFADRVGFLKDDPDFPGCFIYKSPDELTEEQRSVVERVNTSWHKRERVINGEKIVVERQEFTYVLSDKANALQQMGRHFGIFDDKLRLENTGQNPFKNASPEQLAALKRSFIETMAGGQVVDGEFRETKPAHLLSHGKGRTGTGG